MHGERRTTIYPVDPRRELNCDSVSSVIVRERATTLESMCNCGGTAAAAPEQRLSCGKNLVKLRPEHTATHTKPLMHTQPLIGSWLEYAESVLRNRLLLYMAGGGQVSHQPSKAAVAIY